MYLILLDRPSRRPFRISPVITDASLRKCTVYSISIVPSPASRRLDLGLDLLQALLELLPVVHNGNALGFLGQKLGHLLHLLLALFDAVDANVANARNAGAHGRSSTALAVLDGNSLGGLNAELLSSVDVDGWVGLGAGWVERGGGGVDVLGREEVGDAGLLYGGNDTALGRGADDGHGVALFLELVKLSGNTGALDGLLAELLGDSTKLLLDIVVELGVGHGEVVLLLEALEHATEVVSDEVLEQRVGGVAGVDVVLLHDDVGQLSASREGHTLRLDERVVAVEHDVLDLPVC